MSSGIFYPHDFQLDVCTFWLPSPVSHPNSPQQPHALLASGSHQSVLWALFACLDFTYKWYYMVFFFLWLISLSIMPSRPILIDKCQNFIILWFNNIPFYVYKYIYVNTHAYFIYIYTHTYIISSIHLWVDTYVASIFGYCTYCWSEHVRAYNFSCECVYFYFLDKLPKIGISWSYGTSIFIFLKKLHTVFHSGCISLQQCTRIPFLHILANTCYFFIFLILNIPTGVRCYGDFGLHFPDN